MYDTLHAPEDRTHDDALNVPPAPESLHDMVPEGVVPELDKSVTCAVNLSLVPGNTVAGFGVIDVDVSCGRMGVNVPELEECLVSPPYVADIVMTTLWLDGNTYDTLHTPEDRTHDDALNVPPAPESLHDMVPEGTLDELVTSVTFAPICTCAPGFMEPVWEIATDVPSGVPTLALDVPLFDTCVALEFVFPVF